METADKLAEALGFHRVKSGAGGAQIISRFPILECIEPTGMDPARSVAAKIHTGGEPGHDVIFYNIHLDAGHYGPYAARPPEGPVLALTPVRWTAWTATPGS